MQMETFERNPTILVIDNDDRVLTALATRLQYMGYRCITAVTGAQGVALFEHDQVDLIITDLNMPVMDGFGVITKVRELQPDVPLIVLTGYRKDYHEALRHLRRVTIVEKPCRARDLIDMVETELFLGPCSQAA